MSKITEPIRQVIEQAVGPSVQAIDFARMGQWGAIFGSHLADSMSETGFFEGNITYVDQNTWRYAHPEGIALRQRTSTSPGGEAYNCEVAALHRPYQGLLLRFKLHLGNHNLADKARFWCGLSTDPTAMFAADSPAETHIGLFYRYGSSVNWQWSSDSDGTGATFTDTGLFCGITTIYAELETTDGTSWDCRLYDDNETLQSEVTLSSDLPPTSTSMAYGMGIRSLAGADQKFMDIFSAVLVTRNKP